MSEALTFDRMDRDFGRRGKKAAENDVTEKLSLLLSKDATRQKAAIKVLNEKLAHFYNNGGPIMDEKEGLVVKTMVKSGPLDRRYRFRRNNITSKPKRAETVSLVSKDGPKIVTMEYLNEKLTYFYNNGGPVMDL